MSPHCSPSRRSWSSCDRPARPLSAAGVNLLTMPPVLRSRHVRALGGLLALLLALTGCTSALGRQQVGAPTPVAVSGSAPAGRTDPATSPDVARFYGQSVTWSACGAGFQCTKVTAPIDWSRPTTGTFQLALARLPAAGKRLGSLLINPGGPGV